MKRSLSIVKNRINKTLQYFTEKKKNFSLSKENLFQERNTKQRKKTEKRSRAEIFKLRQQKLSK